MVMEPRSGSKSLTRRAVNVVFPDPVGPMIAVIDPGVAEKLTSSRTGRSDS